MKLIRYFCVAILIGFSAVTLIGFFAVHGWQGIAVLALFVFAILGAAFA